MNTLVPGKWYYWITLAIIVKGILFLILTAELGDNGDGFIGIRNSDEGVGDSNSYIVPAENLFTSGTYTPDYRLPGYVPIYYLLRFGFEPLEAKNLLIVVQLLLGAISTYLLALTAILLFQSRRLFYLIFFTFLFSTYTQIFDLYLLSESLTVSMSIFALYHLVSGIKNKKFTGLLLSGFWTTWVIFLRPVYIPYMLLFSVLILLFFYKASIPRWQIAGKGLVIFLLPFILIDGIWVYRNYKAYSKFQPFMKSIYYPDIESSYFLACMDFLRHWGGSYVFWDPSAEIRLLGIVDIPHGGQIKSKDNLKFPDNIYTSAYNEDSLMKVRDLIVSLEKKQVPSDSIRIVTDNVREKLARYTASIKSENIFLYHVTSRLRYTKLYLLHSGTYNLMRKPWIELSFIKKLFKIFYSALYVFILFAGSVGALLILRRKWNSIEAVIPLLVFFGLFIFPLVLRLLEMRYFAPTYPFMLVCAMYVTNEVISRLKSRNQSATSKNKVPVHAEAIKSIR